jgi:hypothetical protein
MGDAAHDMTPREYQTTTFTSVAVDHSVLDETLSALGRDGWRLVATHMLRAGGPQERLLFVWERETAIPDEQERQYRETYGFG